MFRPYISTIATSNVLLVALLIEGGLYGMGR